MKLLALTTIADVTVNTGGIGWACIILVVAIILLSFAWWVIQNYVPEPMRKFAVLVVVLVCVLVLCNFVLSLGGHGFIRF